MSDLILLGSTGLRSYQTALQIVGDNITNASTPGYSRRSATLHEASASGLGDPLATGTSSGNGVNVTGIARAYDQFRSADARVASGDYQKLDARQRWLADLQSNLGTGNGSVGDGLTKFFNAAQDVASDPTASAPRLALLNAAGTVAQRFHTAAAGITSTQTGIRTEISSTVARANQISQSLATINQQLQRSQPDSTQSASLSDQRDSLLDELGTMMRVGVSQNADGSVEVRMGDTNGPSLVSGSTSKLIGTTLSNGATQLTVDPFGSNTVTAPGSGSLAGLLEAEAKTSDAARQLDTLAASFVADINAQHVLGKDLSGTAGTPLFNATGLTVAASRTNVGTASVTPTVTGAIDPQGYQLWYSSGSSQWTLSRTDGSGAVSGTGSLDLDGVHVDLGGTPRSGDHFAIAGGLSAASISVAITDPSKIAASANGDAGDAGNLLSLINMRLPAQGGYEQTYEKQVSSLATSLADTKSLAAASKSLSDSTSAARDAGSSVNLDDEAADLLRYQQAYQACSKIISIAQTIFDSLIEIR